VTTVENHDNPVRDPRLPIWPQQFFNPLPKHTKLSSKHILIISMYLFSTLSVKNLGPISVATPVGLLD
jgi:hypothetical protein